ncbi:ankyrin repeat domain-containing protein SOWAHB-like [Megalops cyprinoides]|uniref:ankyrin repeat domain-containing protein SOWAHB-like n=1 Tax=Megalops cyprinoides TaxID=118141 RepID=UPI0018640933|nr:ankyrin repeat domain-containing protein SOWAHB-like [Megalops cyprinoides]
MGDVSEESLLDYIFTAGGKVKNADLLKTYKHFVNHNDKQLRAKYREEFKLVIDKIAVVKSENGEKYLVLKKKYKQLMQEREAEKGMPRQRQASPPRPAAMVQWEGGEVLTPDSSQKSPGQDTYPSSSAPTVQTEVKKPAMVSWCGAPAITVTEAPEQEAEDRGQQIDEAPSLSVAEETSDVETEERSTSQDDDSPVPIDGEDQLDRDTESKGEVEQEAEPEQEEEGTGSIGSNSVALDPLEKEWMHSAACGRLVHLTQLLKQEPSLAYKKDFTSGDASAVKSRMGILGLRSDPCARCPGFACMADASAKADFETQVTLVNNGLRKRP